MDDEIVALAESPHGSSLRRRGEIERLPQPEIARGTLTAGSRPKPQLYN